MKNKILNPSKLIEGQKLWDVRYGEVTFINFSINNTNSYPTKCMLHDNTTKTYTTTGKAYFEDLLPSLYLSNPTEQVNEFPRIMQVSDDKILWFKRTVLAYNKDGNNYIAFDSASKRIVIYWKYAKKIQEPIITEYTLEEIATKLGVDVNSIRIKK